MATVTALARRFRIDIDVNYPGAADWQQLTGITDFKPDVDPTMQDADDYDSDGWGRTEKTMQKWSVEMTFFRKQDETGAFPAAQEELRNAETKFGIDARAHIRWYDKSGAAEAREGVGLVKWARANSAVADLDAAQVTITGDGPLTDITNPLA